MTPEARDALEHLRDAGNFSWSIVPIAIIVLYLYFAEAERRNWSGILAGLAFWGMDWFNEIWNSLVFHWTGRAPVWGAVGDSNYQLLIGLNIEISLMFLVLGLASTKLLPADRAMRIAGLPNRAVIALVNALLCVGVEILLNQIGVLTWDWSWWRMEMPVLILLVGYLPFFVAAYLVYDMKQVKHKVATVGAILGIDVAALAVFGSLGWL